MIECETCAGFIAVQALVSPVLRNVFAAVVPGNVLKRDGGMRW